MGWSTTIPLSSESVSGSTASIRANWDAIAAAFSVEHGALTSASSGQHPTGTGMGFLKYGTTAEISAATSPGTGALAYDSSKGILETYHASAGWGSITRDSFSRVRAWGGQKTPVPSTWTDLGPWFVSLYGYYDGLGEHFSSKIIIKDSGFYLVHANCDWGYEGSDCMKQVEIKVNGVYTTIHIEVGKYIFNWEMSDILSLTTGDYIELYAWHDAATNQYITAYLTLTRLS
jgi:hypothetical protein